MGKFIRSKKHYEEEMRKGGYVSFEEGQRIAEKARRDGHKDFKPSEEMKEFAGHLVNTKPRKKKFRLSDREIDKIKSMGVSDKIPEGIPMEGGFDAT